MIKKVFFILGVIVIFFFFQQCRKFEFQKIDGVKKSESEFAVPILNTNVKLKDLVDDINDFFYLSIDESGLLSLNYRGDVLSKYSSEFLGDIVNALPSFIPVPDTVTALPFSSTGELTVDIDKGQFSQGFLEYYFQSYHEEDVDVTIKIPNISKDGVPITFTKHVDYTGSTPIDVLLDPHLDLTGYILEPENDSIYVIYEAIRESGIRDTLTNFLIGLSDLNFSYIEGYMGNYVHDGERDTIEIDIFEKWIQGDMYFAEPKVSIDITNSFGVPTKSITQIFQIESVHGEIIPLESEYIHEGIDFNYPSLEEVGQEKTTHFEFTTENSNIDVILGAGPVALDYDVDAILNPDSIITLKGFMTDSSFYKVRVEVQLPLYGYANRFSIIDTFDIKLSEYPNTKEIEFKLIADNGIPLDVEIQGYFIDENWSVLDSLFETGTKVIESAKVDEAGEVVANTEATSFIPIDVAKFDKIRNSQRILLKAAFSTYEATNSSYVKIYSDQEVNIRMGMKLKRQF